MAKIEFLDPEEAEKFKKQKWNVFCWTPCIISIAISIARMAVRHASKLWAKDSTGGQSSGQQVGTNAGRQEGG